MTGGMTHGIHSNSQQSYTQNLDQGYDQSKAGHQYLQKATLKQEQIDLLIQALGPCCMVINGIHYY